ncbi:MAG: hypothetical protein ABSF64_28085 [Bryobacteraceae bacterium]|jgi:hypothetical protein
MPDREQLRAMMIENAAEINRLTRRIHEAAKRRSESEKLRQEWSQACKEFHARYAELCIPGGFDANFYERILAGDPATIEVALCFLEVRPYFFRSGYLWKTILRKCKRAPMSAEQCERFARLVEKYTEWKRLRGLSAQRGAAVRQDLLPLLLHLSKLFPTKLSDGKVDGLVTVGDLYNVLCAALKLEPHGQPEKQKGVIGDPRRAIPQADIPVRAREYIAWRYHAWTPEDVWETLVSALVEVYKPDASFVISSETILRQPSGD